MGNVLGTISKDYARTIDRRYSVAPMKLTPMDEMKAKLQARYEMQGFAEALFRNDWNLILRMGVHPQKATVEDIQRTVTSPEATSTKGTYASRFRSIFKTLNKMKVIDNNAYLDLPPVRKSRGLPHPLTGNEARLVMTEAEMPMRHWFIIACNAGLRAMEVANLRGIDLEQRDDGYILRVAGKGGTDLTIPIAPKVAEVILSYNTQGRLWDITSNALSKMTSAEMKRLGIANKTFHACRHYFATNMLEKSGGDLLAVRDLMRHSSVATTQVYTQLASGRTRSLVNLL